MSILFCLKALIACFRKFSSCEASTLSQCCFIIFSAISRFTDHSFFLHFLSPTAYISKTPPKPSLDIWSRQRVPALLLLFILTLSFLFIFFFKSHSWDLCLVPSGVIAPLLPREGVQWRVGPEMRSLLPLSVYCISLVSLQQLLALPAVQERPDRNR